MKKKLLSLLVAATMIGFRAGYLISYGNNKTKFGQKGFLLGSSSRAGS